MAKVCRNAKHLPSEQEKGRNDEADEGPSDIPGPRLDRVHSDWKVRLWWEEYNLLGDSVRLRIFITLPRPGEGTVQKLAEATAKSHQNTSKHLRALARSGLVGCCREGARITEGHGPRRARPVLAGLWPASTGR